MTQKNVQHTQGTRFQRDNGTGWDDISQCKDIVPADVSRTTIDVTTIDQYDGSDPDLYKQYVGGLLEAGDCSLELVFDPRSISNQRIIEGDIDAPNPLRYRILYIDGATDTFYAILKSMKRTNPMDDVTRQSLTLKVSGKPVYEVVA